MPKSTAIPIIRSQVARWPAQTRVGFANYSNISWCSTFRRLAEGGDSVTPSTLLYLESIGNGNQCIVDELATSERSPFLHVSFRCHLNPKLAKAGPRNTPCLTSMHDVEMIGFQS